MKMKDSRLGPQERFFLASVAGMGKRIISHREALPYWKSTQQAIKALNRLENKGWLRRLERGVYLLIPLEAGPEGQWSEDPLVIATQLVSEGAVAYWSALHYWNMTAQVPRTVFVQTTSRRYRPRREILGVRYRFVTVKVSRFFAALSRASDGMAFRVTDREKTLVDACDRPDLCGGISQVAEALKSGEQVDWHKLSAYLERFESGAVYKRLGFLVETLDITMPDKKETLAEWQSKLTQGISWLEPGGEQTGSVVTRWRVRVNVRGLG